MLSCCGMLSFVTVSVLQNVAGTQIAEIIAKPKIVTEKGNCRPFVAVQPQIFRSRVRPVRFPYIESQDWTIAEWQFTGRRAR